MWSRATGGSRDGLAGLTIVHTSDLHGDRYGALDRAGRLLRRIPGAVWFDSGDALRAWNLTLGLTWERTLARMTELGCSAMAMGNREFEPLVPCHRMKLAAAGFPVICTNLVHPRPRSVPVVPEVRFRAPDGRRIRVFGALRDMLRSSVSRRLSAYRFRAPLEPLSRRCATVEPDELVVLLSHLGGASDRDLLAMLPRLDLILGGHDHQGRCERSGRRAIVAPQAHGRQLALITVRPDEPPIVRFVSSPWEEADAIAEATAGP